MLRHLILATSSLVLVAVLARQIYLFGPPYFSRPVTIADRFGSSPDDARDALLLMQNAARVIPRGSVVTCFKPRQGRQWNDTTSYLIAIGMLPDHVILPPFTADESIDYVIAVKEPFVHSAYDVFARFPQGAVYRVKR